MTSGAAASAAAAGSAGAAVGRLARGGSAAAAAAVAAELAAAAASLPPRGRFAPDLAGVGLGAAAAAAATALLAAAPSSSAAAAAAAAAALSAFSTGQCAARCAVLPHTMQEPPRGYAPWLLAGQSRAMWPRALHTKHAAKDRPPPRTGSGQARSEWPGSPQLKQMAGAGPASAAAAPPSGHAASKCPRLRQPRQTTLRWMARPSPASKRCEQSRRRCSHEPQIQQGSKRAAMEEVKI